MRIIHNFKQANKALSQFVSLDRRKPYTLDRMERLMDLFDNPQNKLKIIHVAGTSGKSSTSYYMASLLKNAGNSVGLTVSPHINEINERVQINLLPLSENDYCVELSNFLDKVNNSGINPSYFEVLVAFAFWLFRKKNVDYAVVEVGLGGLLDGTNVIDRNDKVCVITDIGLDHVEILGRTVSKIAIQKAGIIQKGNEVFMHQQDQSIMDSIKKICLEKKANFHECHFLKKKVGFLTLLPLFQQRNFSLAMQAVDFVLNRDNKNGLKDKEIKNASKTIIPGRMEQIQYKGDKIILDGAHNEQKIYALVASIKQKFPNKTITVLISFGDNKRNSTLGGLRLLRQLGDKIIITSFSKGQDEIRMPIDVHILAAEAKKVGFKNIVVEANAKRALELLSVSKTTIKLVTGSFYLLSQIKQDLARYSRTIQIAEH